jgi:hypothetical protein
MRLAKIAIMMLGFVMIVGIAKGAIALLIGLFAVMIPLIAVVAYSPIGEAIAKSIGGTDYNSSGVSAGEFNQLKDKHDRLESRFKEYEDEMNKMREALIFSDNKKILTSTGSSEENKIKLNNQINLEKTL